MVPPSDRTFDFVLVGAQRGGSTQLSACLRDHPQLSLAADEVPYFEDPFFLRSSTSALAPLFEAARPGQRVGIPCPSYLGRSEVAARLKAHSPDARVIAVLRDPVARAISAYFWYVQFGMLPLVPLAEGMAALLDGWTDRRYPQAWEVLDWSFYGRHLRPYVELFAGRMVVLGNGELDRPGTYELLYEALDVERHHRPAPRASRRNEGVYDLRRLRLLRARRRFAWSWADTERYEHRPRRLRRPLRFLPNAMIVGLDRLVLARLLGNRAPCLPLELARRLEAHYARDVALLESLVPGADRLRASWR